MGYEQKNKAILTVLAKFRVLGGFHPRQKHVGGRRRDTHTADKVRAHGHTLLFYTYSETCLERPPRTAATCVQRRFFVHRQFHTETALQIATTCLARSATGFFVHRRPVFPCVEQPGDDPKPPFCEVPQQKFDGKPRSAQAEKPTSTLSRFARCLCSL